MKEGCATTVHCAIMTRLHETGQITDGAFMEFLHAHTNVVFQPDFDDRRFSGINPYAFGFGILQDLKRVCEAPTEEDRRWFPDIAGNADTLGTWKTAWAEYRDESFILQFLSPQLMRRWRLFSVLDDTDEDALAVEAHCGARSGRRGWSVFKRETTHGFPRAVRVRNPEAPIAATRHFSVHPSARPGGRSGAARSGCTRKGIRCSLSGSRDRPLLSAEVARPRTG